MVYKHHNNTIRLTIQHKAALTTKLLVLIKVVSAALYCIVRRIVLLLCLYTDVTFSIERQNV